jgi:peptidoglycan/LPS O-acetylase OafA/YrhL
MIKRIKYFDGLNSLRFFAAFLVIIYHANGSLIKLGLIQDTSIPILNKGSDAVDFFFTLSGFLITYLLLKEIEQTGNVSIKKFYIRRALRIWPVYFAIVLFRFFLYAIVYKLLLQMPDTDFPIIKGAVLYVFFLPNLAAIIYNVGLLHPLWSIGVEEQFYLFWAPLVKLFRHKIKYLLITLVVLSLSWYCIIHYNTIHLNPLAIEFLLSQKFYAMIIGAVFGYIIFYHFDFYNNSFFSKKIIQYCVLIFLLYYYAGTNILSQYFWVKLMLPVWYGIFILNVSAVKNKIISLEKKPLVFLGEISYGLYMYHMVIDFFLRAGFQKLMKYNINHAVLVSMYFILIIGGTIAFSYFSYKYFEAFFLRRKHQFSTV